MPNYQRLYSALLFAWDRPFVTLYRVNQIVSGKPDPLFRANQMEQSDEATERFDQAVLAFAYTRDFVVGCPLGDVWVDMLYDKVKIAYGALSAQAKKVRVLPERFDLATKEE